MHCNDCVPNQGGLELSVALLRTRLTLASLTSLSRRRGVGMLSSHQRSRRESLGEILPPIIVFPTNNAANNVKGSSSSFLVNIGTGWHFSNHSLPSCGSPWPDSSSPSPPSSSPPTSLAPSSSSDPAPSCLAPPCSSSGAHGCPRAPGLTPSHSHPGSSSSSASSVASPSTRPTRQNSSPSYQSQTLSNHSPASKSCWRSRSSQWEQSTGRLHLTNSSRHPTTQSTRGSTMSCSHKRTCQELPMREQRRLELIPIMPSYGTL